MRKQSLYTRNHIKTVTSTHSWTTSLVILELMGWKQIGKKMKKNKMCD